MQLSMGSGIFKLLLLWFIVDDGCGSCGCPFKMLGVKKDNQKSL